MRRSERSFDRKGQEWLLRVTWHSSEGGADNVDEYDLDFHERVYVVGAGKVVLLSTHENVHSKADMLTNEFAKGARR